MPYGLEFFEQLPYANFYEVCQIVELEIHHPEAGILLQMLAQNSINQQARSLLYLQVYFLCAELGVLEADAESWLQDPFFCELYKTNEEVLASLVVEKLKVASQEITRYQACVQLFQVITVESIHTEYFHCAAKDISLNSNVPYIKSESPSHKMEKTKDVHRNLIYTCLDQESCRKTLRFILNLQAYGVAVANPIAWEKNKIHFALTLENLTVSSQSSQLKTLAFALTELGYKIVCLSENDFYIDDTGSIWLINGYETAFASTKNPDQKRALHQLETHFGLSVANVTPNKETYLQSITSSLPEESELSSLLECQTDDDIIDVTTSTSQEYSADSCEIFDY